MAEIAVAPFVGAWIETSVTSPATYPVCVAPFVGAWIETLVYEGAVVGTTVAPFVGAWIETLYVFFSSSVFLSLPSWERGLKLYRNTPDHAGRNVAPFVGAWIETLRALGEPQLQDGRSLRGSVD